MHVYPVLDVLNGVVVRGVAGRRETYRPIRSRLASDADVVTVARAFREHLGLSRLYLADLDGILEDRPNEDVFRTLAGEGFDLLVDAGVRSLRDGQTILEAGGSEVVAALETLPGPGVLEELVARFGPGRIVFSLDLQHGKPLGDAATWETSDPLEMAGRAVAAGVERMIVLDLAQVGTDAGPSTRELCERLLDRHPQLRLITGGGIREADDLRVLERMGVEGALVASALHDGRIGRQELDQFRS